jgi:hypothetical protein
VTLTLDRPCSVDEIARGRLIVRDMYCPRRQAFVFLDAIVVGIPEGPVTELVLFDFNIAADLARAQAAPS